MAKSVSASAAEGPGLLTKVTAIVVLLALAALASYAMFSGPTTISVKSSTKATPSRTSHAGGRANSEPKESGRGD